MRRGRGLVIVALLVGVGLAIFLWLEGSDYYTTHPWDRAQHPEYDRLRSSGIWGHGLGIIGTGLILANLTFLLRRRLKSFRRFGALRTWMDMHVLTGLIGPLIVLYHTTFHPRTAVATIALVSLGVLVVTGIIGRFIYAMIPHTVAGAEMGRAALAARLEEARAHLSQAIPEDAPLWRVLERLSRPPRALPKSTIAGLLTLPLQLVSTTWLRLRLWLVGREQQGVAWQDLRDYALIRRRVDTVTLYRRILRWWRAMHRWIAAVMVVAMIVHVVVALYFGYMPGDGGF